MGIDEWLFYGGLAATALVAVLAVISAVSLKFKKLRLDETLDEEYGKQQRLNQQLET